MTRSPTPKCILCTVSWAQRCRHRAMHRHGQLAPELTQKPCMPVAQVAHTDDARLQSPSHLPLLGPLGSCTAGRSQRQVSCRY